ncbi:MAG: hypothetical protein IAE89_02235, partial [Anaerolineae bacterium]|nr:hypothetical protein [Anaerolineae bacterium]
FGYDPSLAPGSHAAFTRSLTLPFYPQMDEASFDKIAIELRAAVSECTVR